MVKNILPQAFSGVFLAVLSSEKDYDIKLLRELQERWTLHTLMKFQNTKFLFPQGFQANGMITDVERNFAVDVLAISNMASLGIFP